MTSINIFTTASLRDTKRTRTINIRSTIQNTTNNIAYYVKFTINELPCVDPIITVYFEDTDFNGVDKFLHIYYENETLASCGSNTDTCGDYKYCINDSPLLNNSDGIPAGEQIIIKLEKGKQSNIPTGCEFSLYADITLTCDSPLPSVSPTFAPTPYLEQNPNIVAMDECNYNEYCYDFTLAQVYDLDSESTECSEICEQSQLLSTGMDILFNVNLVTSIIEIVAFLIEMIVLCAWNSMKYKTRIVYFVSILQLIFIFSDIILEIASGSIIIDYDMIHSLGLLYENQCFTRVADENINDITGDVEQILLFSWFEASLSVAMFVIGIIKLKKWREDEYKENTNKWIIGISVLAGFINVVLAALTFFCIYIASV